MDMNDTNLFMEMSGILYIYYQLKFLDLADTIFFIARKKFMHVSALQVS
jgi:hypothetical protein